MLTKVFFYITCAVVIFVLYSSGRYRVCLSRLCLYSIMKILLLIGYKAGLYDIIIVNIWFICISYFIGNQIRNDSAFVVDASLSIYEHQSTVCPNMPIRSMIYFTAILSDMLSGRGGVNKLIMLLLSDGRAEDLKRFASDKEYQMQLLKEYGLM